MTLYLGSEFKTNYPNDKFFRITNDGENHHGFKYSTGLNVNTQEFKTTTCSYGLYFTNLSNLSYWINNSSVFLREVEILDNSIVCVEDIKTGKFKTNKFSLGEKVKIFDSNVWNDIELCKKLITADKYYINLITNKSYELILFLMEKYIDYNYSLDDFKNAPLDIKIKLIKLKPKLFKDLEDTSEDLCNVAIKYDGSNIQYIESPSEQQCWDAIKQNPINIKYIKNITDTMIIYAISHNINVDFLKKDKEFSSEILQMIQYFNNNNNINNIDNIDNIDNLPLDTDDAPTIVKTVKNFLNDITSISGHTNRKNFALKMFTYIVRHPTYLKNNKGFKDTVIVKLQEFKKQNDFSNEETDYFLNKITSI
jgi:DNA-dependent RNA polymerase auxiliary subunit epsilon